MAFEKFVPGEQPAEPARPKQAPPKPKRPFLDVAAVADQLCVDGRTVRGLIARKQLRAYRIGKEWRIRPGDVDAFLESAVNT